jgi:hypothetical protein
MSQIMEMKVLPLAFVILFVTVTTSFSQTIKCYEKNEVGEMSGGTDFIFERTDELDKSRPSLFNFDELTVVNAVNGQFTDIENVGTNLFGSENGYLFLTNDKRTIVMEIKFGESVGLDLIYSKILFCEPF